MTMKIVIAKQARGVALAGFFLCLTGGWAVVSGGEPSGWKDRSSGAWTTTASNSRRPTAAPTVMIFYSPECPISNAL